MELTRAIRDGRIEICKDVIDRIENHDLYVVSSAAYLASKSSDDWNLVHEILSDGVASELDAQGIVDAIEPFCQVCARGAMMLSKARLFDDMPLTAIATLSGQIGASRDDTGVALEDHFDAEDLAQIEVAFEVSMLDITNRTSASIRAYDWNKLRGAWNFGRTASTGYNYFSGSKHGSRKRCLAVMQNIVKHDGVFTFWPVSLSNVAYRMTCGYANYQYPDFVFPRTEADLDE